MYCFIHPGYSPTKNPILLGPYESIDKALEAGLQVTAGTPEDPVNQGNWTHTEYGIGYTTLRHAVTMSPILTVLESTPIW